VDIVTNIEKEFHPSIFTKSLNSTIDIKLCLVKSKFLARYCLCVFELKPDMPINLQIEEARRSIKKHLKASVFLRSVGVYIIFISDSVKGFAKNDLIVDRTGLHSVIIQGVHIISTSGEHIYNHTKWLNYAFGNTVNIAQKVESIAI
jgi:hypothetical protein